MNNKLINNKLKIIVLTNIFLIEKKLRMKKVGIFSDFTSDPDPESESGFALPDPDPRLRVHIKMILIHNTLDNNSFFCTSKYRCFFFS